MSQFLGVIKHATPEFNTLSGYSNLGVFFHNNPIPGLNNGSGVMVTQELMEKNNLRPDMMVSGKVGIQDGRWVITEIQPVYFGDAVIGSRPLPKDHASVARIEQIMRDPLTKFVL